MSLFEKLNNKRSSLHEVKDDGIKKPTKKANKEVFDVTGKSAAKDAKKYASGEYSKIGGGERMTPKSKGPGASTGGTKIPSATVGGKSKGTTPVKVNITKPIKQSEVSKKAKSFTQDINKKRTKKVFPGDKSGAYKATKIDIETRKGFSKNKPGGLKADETNKFVKRSVRKARVDKIGGDIYNQPKFSQKGFEKSLLGTKTPKTPSQPIIGGGGGAGSKAPSFKPSSFKKPPNPFGKGDTKGQMNVKAMDKKSFKITQKKDVQLPKSFTDFSKKLKTLKTDVAKTASATPRTVTKKYKPTTTVKQSEVSKQAKDFTKKTNQTRVAKIKNVVKDSKVKNSKGIGNKFRGEKNIAAKNARIKLDQNAAYGGGGKQPPKNNKPLSSPNNSNKIVKQSKYDKIKAGVDAKNPTKPGQYTGKPVPLKQREFTSFKNKYLSTKGKKFVEKVPKVFKNKTFAKIGKAALKSPVVAAAAGVGLAAAGAYAGYKAIKNMNKGKTKLNYSNFKALSTKADKGTPNENKGKIIDRETGKVANFSSASKIPKSSSAEFKSKYYYK